MITIESPDARFANGEDFLWACASRRYSPADKVARLVIEHLQEVSICKVRGCSNEVAQFAFGVVDEEPWVPADQDHDLTMHFLAVCSEHPLSDVADDEIFPDHLRFWLERRGEHLYPRPLTAEGWRLAERDAQVSASLKAEKAERANKAGREGQRLRRLN